MSEQFPWETQDDLPLVPRQAVPAIPTSKAETFPWEVEEAQVEEGDLIKPDLGQRTQARVYEAGRETSKDLQGRDMVDFDTSNIDPATMEKFGTPKEPWDHRVAGVLRETTEATGDILLDGGITAVKNMVPDDWQDSIKDFSRTTWDKFMSSPVFREGIEMLGSTAEAYGKWAKKYPAYADAIGDAIAVGSWARPNLKTNTRDLESRQRANKSDWEGRGYGEQLGLTSENYVSGTTPSAPKRTGDKIVDSAEERTRQGKLGQIKNDLEPIGAERDPTRVRYGELGTKYYELTPFDESVAKEVARIPQYSTKRSLIHNMNAVRNQAIKLKEGLESKIVKLGNPEIDVAGVKNRLAKIALGLPEENMLSKPSKEYVSQAFRKINSLIDESDGTVLDLLRARRKFDDWMKQQGTSLDSDIINARNVTARSLRTEMNNIVGEAFNSPFVAESLERQHKLWSAVDRLAPKADKEARTFIGRWIKKAEDITTMRLPTTPLAAGATVGAGAYLLGTPLGAGLAGSAAVGMAGVGGLKWLAGPSGQAMLGRAVQLAQDYPALRPQVIALSQLYEQATSVYGEQEEQ